VHCFGCGYDLSGLSKACCPECSRAFDPKDARTFSPGPPQFLISPTTARRVRLVHTVLVLCPFSALLWGHLAYALACQRLGRRPDPPDHFSVGVVEGTFWALFRISMYLSLTSLIAAVVLPWFCYPPYPPRGIRIRLRVVLGVACMLTAYVLAQFDPFGAMDWMFD
jgi:hypothetical protein